MTSIVPEELSTLVGPSEDQDTKPSVLVIVTGGTICMTYAGVSDSLTPSPLAKRLREMPDFVDASLPKFQIFEWLDLVDSSDISLEHWVRIARDIEQNYHKFDGFVVLHGTDTLAYTASALAFMLENLNKPVVLTGSMLPLCHIQTDARRNLAVALMIAAYSQVTEVCILFGSRLLRGNRARKLDCSQMDAFNSPNFPRLGHIGVDVTIDDQLLLNPSKRGFRIFPHFSMNVVTVTITPGFHTSLLRHLFASPARPFAVILLLYGSGTAPMKDEEFLKTIELGIRQNVEILCLTQCSTGTCSLLTYENGALLYHLGVIEGKDMTPEAAFAKLAYLLGKGYTGEDLRTLMEQDCRGELTERPVKVTGQAYLVSRVRPANRASCVVSATSLSRGNSLNKSSTFDAPATLPEGLCQTNSLSAESTPVKSSLPSSFYRRSGKPLDGLLGYVRRSAPDLHTETHPLIHTLKSERDGFGHSHFEVPDCYSLNNTPNPELNP